MPLQHTTHEIVDGSYIYFEGRYYVTDEELGFIEKTPAEVGEILTWEMLSKPTSLQIQDWVDRIEEQNDAPLEVNPLNYDPTPEHIAQFSEDTETAIPPQSDFPTGLNLNSLLSLANSANSSNDKDAASIWMKRNEEHKALYIKNSNKIKRFLEEIGEKFKPDGSAAVLSKKIVSFADELLGELHQALKYYREYEKGHAELQVTVRKLQDNIEKLQIDILRLRETHFDISQFAQFCESLYSTLDKNGPKIKTMQDLPKLTDYVYTQVLKKQCSEPELP